MTDHDTLDLDQYPEGTESEALRAAMATRAPDPERARLALKTLAARYPDEVLPEAQRVAADPTLPDSLRSVAAVELGRHAEPETQQTLIEMIPTASPGLSRHVFRALGQIGGESTLEVLEAANAPEGPARTALGFARSLISYRIGLPRYLLEPIRPDRKLDVLRRPVELEIDQLGRDRIEAALPDLRRQLPRLSFQRDHGTVLVCGGTEHWILMNEEVASDGGRISVSERPMIAGVIVKFRECSNRFSLDEYLLVNGDGGERVTLLGTRPSGIVVHSGSIRLVGDEATFVLEATNPPYGRPLELQGRADAAGRLSFSQARIDSWTREQPAKRPPPRHR